MREKKLTLTKTQIRSVQMEYQQQKWWSRWEGVAARCVRRRMIRRRFRCGFNAVHDCVFSVLWVVVGNDRGHCGALNWFLFLLCKRNYRVFRFSPPLGSFSVSLFIANKSWLWVLRGLILWDCLFIRCYFFRRLEKGFDYTINVSL